MRLILTFFACLLTLGLSAQAPAFPGAEGHARYVTGGRDGKVVHVTNLNNSGTGSLRSAVSGSSAKIVVFDVAGVIALESDLNIGANTTILGQTAPYPGITLRYYTIKPNGDNIIIRFLRFRRGEEKDVDDDADACYARRFTGLMLDHCSFSWSIDEVASFYDNNNFTMQWSTVSEALTNPGHSKGAHGYGGIWGGKLASFHHNLIAHVSNRGPRFNGARYEWSGYTSNSEYDTYNWVNTVAAENVDFRNCVMYNAQGTCYGGPGGGQVNIVNNYYKAGPCGNGSQERVTTVSAGESGNSTPTDMLGMTSRYYISGNTTETTSGTVKTNRDWNGITYDSGIYSQDGLYYSEDPSGYYAAYVDDDYIITVDGTTYVQIKMDTENPTGDVTTHSAANAYEKVLDYAGASLFRDDVDARYMHEVENGTATYTGSVTLQKGLIDFVSDVDGYTEDNFPTGSRDDDFDTDDDGMPDEWETANGLDPNDASDALTYTLDSKGYYMNIEVYANHLVESIMQAENEDAESSVDEYWPTVSTVSSLEYYTGRVVELVDTDDVTLSEGVSGTITWAFNTGEAGDATIASDIAEGISATSVSFGSNVALTGSSQSVNGTDFNLINPTEKESAAASTNAISFNVTTADGYYFEPTGVSFLASRIGTDNCYIDVVWSGASTTTISSALTPNRNNETGGWWTEYDETVSADAYSGTSSLTVYAYNIANNKQLGLCNVVISGTLKTETTAVNHLSVDAEVVKTEYFDITGRQLQSAVRGMNLVRYTMSDGQVIVEKKIVK